MLELVDSDRGRCVGVMLVLSWNDLLRSLVVKMPPCDAAFVRADDVAAVVVAVGYGVGVDGAAGEVVAVDDVDGNVVATMYLSSKPS